MSEREYVQLRDFAKALNADVVKKATARGTSPPWLKEFAGQLEDPEYVELSLAERGFLHDLRLLALRRGNKILVDENYLRGQLRCTPRTLCVPKVDRLRNLGFLEPYDVTTNPAANQLIQSRTALDTGENGSRLEVEVEVEGPPNPPDQGGHEPTAQTTKPPRHRSPPQTTPGAINGTGQGIGYIDALIANGVIGQMFELDEELEHTAVTGTERETLRAHLRERFTTTEGWRLPHDELVIQLEQQGADDHELVSLLELAADRRVAAS